MKLLIAMLIAVPLSVQADIKKDAKYGIADRYCSDGTDAQDKNPSDTEDGAIEFKSDGKYVVYDTDRNFEAGYELEGNVLTIIPATMPDIKIKSTIRSMKDGSFSMFSELPPDAEKAKAICPTGGVLVTVFKLKGSTQE